MNGLILPLLLIIPRNCNGQYPDPYCENGEKRGKACFLPTCPQFGGTGCSFPCCFQNFDDPSMPYCDEVATGNSCKIRDPDPNCDFGERAGDACFPKGCPQFGGSGCRSPCCYGEYQTMARPYCDEAGPGCRIRPTSTTTAQPTVSTVPCEPELVNRWWNPTSIAWYNRLARAGHAGGGWILAGTLGYVCTNPAPDRIGLVDGRPCTHTGCPPFTPKVIGYVYRTSVPNSKPIYEKSNPPHTPMWTNNANERNADYCCPRLVGYALNSPSAAQYVGINNDQYDDNYNDKYDLIEVLSINALISIITCLFVIAICILIYYGCVHVKNSELKPKYDQVSAEEDDDQNAKI